MQQKNTYSVKLFHIRGIRRHLRVLLFFRGKTIFYYDYERRIVMEILIGFIIGVVLTIRGDTDKLICKIKKIVKDFLEKS